MNILTLIILAISVLFNAVLIWAEHKDGKV